MGLINYMVKFFQDGGFWMWPIMIVGGIGAAIAIERHIKLYMVKKANKKMWEPRWIARARIGLGVADEDDESARTELRPERLVRAACRTRDREREKNEAL